MNPNIFAQPVKNAANAENAAGMPAYKDTDPRIQLAQYAMRGTFSDRFYAAAKTDFDKLNELLEKCDNATIAKVAVYAAECGGMKDVPLYLLGKLSKRDAEDEFTTAAADRILSSPKMLKSFFKMIRAGVFGTKSLGSRFQRLINRQIASWSPMRLVDAFVGNDPRLQDVIAMAHTKFEQPSTTGAVYAWAHGYNHDANDLPFGLSYYLGWKGTDPELRDKKEVTLPKVSFQYLTGEKLTPREWKLLAMNCTYNQLRQGLAMFAKNGVFDDEDMTKRIALRLMNSSDIKASGTKPYQMLAAYMHAQGLPERILNALSKGLDYALENVPSYAGETIIMLDISGSMKQVMSTAGKVKSKMKNMDAAAVVAASIIRKNPNAALVVFNGSARLLTSEKPLSSLTTLALAQQLSDMVCGGTSIVSALSMAHRLMTSDVVFMTESHEGTHKRIASRRYDNFVMISDNECNDVGCSFWDTDKYKARTDSQNIWQRIKGVNPNARMVTMDVDVSETRQVIEGKDILPICGFSDKVFEEMADFFDRSVDKKTLLDRIDLYWEEQVKS